MEREHEWIPISQAATLLGCSVHTVRRRVKSGELDSTTDSSIIQSAPKGLGRPPSMLVSIRGVSELRVDQDLGHPDGGSVDADCRERLTEAEAERVRLLAEIESLKEVARLSLVRDDLMAQADAARREQLTQFLTPNFPND